MRIATTFTLTCAVVTLLATTPTSAQSPELNGTSWTLIDLPGTTLLPEAPVTLRFESGRVGGSDGCNTYSGPFASAGGEFAVTGGLVSTRKACPGAVMKQAQAFLDALARARRARVADGRLTLLDAGGTALLTLAAQSQDLAGTAWEVTGYNNGRQAVVSVLTDTTLTLAFEAGGAVNGSAGCNSYHGSYTASGMVVTIGPLAATRKMCATPERVMEQEAAFLKALAMAERARVDGNRLELRTAKGSLAVSARRATAPVAPGPPPRVHGLRLPATFRGSLPCADCEAIRHHLDLWPDQVFHLRREWVGRGLTRDELGRWRVDPARKALVLEGGGEMPLQFEIRGPDTLRQLDMAGKPIVSTLPHDLTSDGTLTPTDLSLALGGELTYMADAARFTECATGHSYPMAMEGGWIEAERAYTAAGGAPGAPLYVTFEGTIADRPKMEGDGTERTVVVTRFIRARPGERCNRTQPR